MTGLCGKEFSSRVLNNNLLFISKFFSIIHHFLSLVDFWFITNFRSSPPEVFLGKGVLKIFSKFAREHPCQSVISIKLQSNFIEITLRHWCSPVNLLHILRTPFPKNTSGGLFLYLIHSLAFLIKPINKSSVYLRCSKWIARKWTGRNV